MVPDKKWREQENKAELACERREHKPNCGIVEEPTGRWTVGDNMHLAVGQGELLTDPLQMAVAYGSAAAALPGSALPSPAQINLDDVVVTSISPYPAGSNPARP